MSSTSTRPAKPGSLERLLSRNSVIVATVLTLAVAIAWAWLLFLSAGGERAQMGVMPMPSEPLSAGYLIPAFGMWSLMMVAMMLPSAAPMILLHARVNRASLPRARLLHTALFGLAYLSVWVGFAAAAATVQGALVATGAVSAAALSVGKGTLAAGLLAATALYELTGAKRLCLDRCQSPLIFIFRYWRPGAAGAFRLGIVHGLYCVGCCWALMLLLFVGGVMNLTWVAVLGIVVLAEKMAPPKWNIERWLAAVSIVGAITLLAR